MKRIIKPGKIGRIECAVCGCEFTFEREDVIMEDHHATGSVTCPFCDHRILMDIAKIPKHDKEVSK